ncbi:hypothetical protein AB205_0003470, partial [Aquarana catesbeiana]
MADIARFLGTAVGHGASSELFIFSSSFLLTQLPAALINFYITSMCSSPPLPSITAPCSSGPSHLHHSPLQLWPLTFTSQSPATLVPPLYHSPTPSYLTRAHRVEGTAALEVGRKGELPVNSSYKQPRDWLLGLRSAFAANHLVIGLLVQ